MDAVLGPDGLRLGTEYVVADFGSADLTGVTFAMTGDNAAKFDAPEVKDGKLVLKAKPFFAIRVAEAGFRAEPPAARACL